MTLTMAIGKICYVEPPALDVGGEIVQPVGADAPEITTRFRDPAGNALGLSQERSLASPEP